MHEELLQELEAQYEVNKSMYEQIELERTVSRISRIRSKTNEKSI